METTSRLISNIRKKELLPDNVSEIMTPHLLSIMNTGKDDITGVKKDIGILKEVIDEIQEDTTDTRFRIELLGKGQEKIMGVLDHIVARLETHRQQDTATTMLIDKHERRITKLETAAA